MKKFRRFFEVTPIRLDQMTWLDVLLWSHRYDEDTDLMYCTGLGILPIMAIIAIGFTAIFAKKIF